MKQKTTVIGMIRNYDKSFLQLPFCFAVCEGCYRNHTQEVSSWLKYIFPYFYTDSACKVTR